ncbi:hypothetical protein J4444_03765 [Candidatus Woesearchaeota archaeon]|nr:hypothetical protein [Candidatus Woesearchaeota archaeon]
MKKIIIDTNALMAIEELHIDLFGELEKAIDFPHNLYVLQGTIDELNDIVKSERWKFRQAAKVALGLLKAKKIFLIDEGGIPGKIDVDDLLVEHSRKGDIILTQDIILKKRLQKPYLTIRQRKMVILVE